MLRRLDQLFDRPGQLGGDRGGNQRLDQGRGLVDMLGNRQPHLQPVDRRIDSSLGDFQPRFQQDQPVQAPHLLNFREVETESLVTPLELPIAKLAPCAEFRLMKADGMTGEVFPDRVAGEGRQWLGQPLVRLLQRRDHLTRGLLERLVLDLLAQADFDETFNGAVVKEGGVSRNPRAPVGKKLVPQGRDRTRRGAKDDHRRSSVGVLLSPTGRRPEPRGQHEETAKHSLHVGPPRSRTLLSSKRRRGGGDSAPSAAGAVPPE